MVQLQILNKIISNKDISIITLNNLDEEYFSDYRREFSFLIKHYNTYGNVCDTVTFLNNFPDFQLLDVEEKDSYLLNKLFDDYKDRIMASTFKELKKLSEKEDIAGAMAVYSKTYQQLNKIGVVMTPVDLIKDTSRLDSYKEKIDNYDNFFVSTGLKELDSVIGGWDREEELATIVARTNNGKSWLLIKFAESAVAQGLRVGIYSGEMSAKKVGYRFDTLAGHIKNGDLVHGNAESEREYENYINNLGTKYSKGVLLVLTPEMINGPAGVSALNTFIEKEHLDILFIDQHSLLEDDKKGKTPVEKASNISKDLKNLQVLKRLPIVSVSQMNRTKSEDEDKIDSTQLAMSDRIAQDSTLILGIQRDKKDRDLFKIQIVKSRDGVAGNVISYKVELNRGIFEYIPTDYDGVQKNSYSGGYKQSYDEDNSPF